MSQLPPEVRDAAARAARNYPNDIDAAADACFAEVSAMPGYAEMVDAFVRSALKSLVEAARHNVNVAIKRSAGVYGGPAKVLPSIESAGLIVESFFDYNMGGKRLGDLRFDDLRRLANEYRQRAEGVLFNARLCEELYRLRPADPLATVESTIKESVVKKLFVTLKTSRTAAAG